MPREPSISQEEVNAVVKSLRAQGVAKPGWRAVRDQLNQRGSPAVIIRMINIAMAGEPQPAASAVTVPESLQRVLVDWIGKEVAGAQAGLQADTVEQRQQITDLIAEAERQGNSIENLTETVERLTSEKAEIAGRIAQVEHDLSLARETAISEAAAAERARTDLAMAELRLEALPRLEEDLGHVRAEIEAERKGRVVAEQQAAVVAARLEALQKALDGSAEREQALAVRLTEANRRLDESRQAEQGARIAEQAGQARLEAATRELEELRRQMKEAKEEAKGAIAETHELRGRLVETGRQLEVVQSKKAEPCP